MGNLIPNEPLIYERVDNKVYARYLNYPDIPRWLIGGQTTMLEYNDWQEMLKLAEQNSTFKKQLDNTLNLYYILKKGNNHG
jgi:hypothetical protein